MLPHTSAPGQDPEQDGSADLVRLVSVNVAQPQVLGRLTVRRREVAVVSAIAKQPVRVDTLYLDWENLEGDGQADRRVHGGPDKAVYAYPADHWPRWREEEGRDFGPASFGENLTVAGWTEAATCIGDVWSWGDALLAIAQPRSPCFKLGMHAGRPGITERLQATGRTGWYLRVFRPGQVPVAGPIRIVERHPARIDVLRAHLATEPGSMTDEERRYILTQAPLADAWQRAIQYQLQEN